MPSNATAVQAIITGSRSAAFRRLNAHLLAPGAALGGLSRALPEPDAVRDSRGPDRRAAESAGGVAPVRPARKRQAAGRRARRTPVLRIHLGVFLRHGRELDDDNLRGGCKLLRDAIAEWLGSDDSERSILWEYSQTHTTGAEGVAVRIEALPRAIGNEP